MSVSIPPGDPGAMRGIAFALNEWAGRVDAIASACAQTAWDTQFEGPAATRFSSAVEADTASASAVSRLLQELSGSLLRDASRLEQQQADARRMLRAEQDRLRHEHRS